MTFEKHLRSVSRAASQRLGILRKSFQVFHDRSLVGRFFLGFVQPVLEYCSALWCSAADTHLNYKTVESVVPVFKLGVCLNVTLHIVDLWQYYVCCTRSGITRCTHFFGALFVPYVLVLVTRGAVIAHWCTYSPPRCRTSQYSRPFIDFSVSLWNDLSDPVLDL